MTTARIRIGGGLVALLLACCTSTSDAPSTPRRAPNVLIILTDDQRSDTLGVMPATRRFFGEGGVRFTNAFATTPQCCPSRASILTGRYAHNHRVLTNYDAGRLDESSTVTRRLQEAGYATAIAGKYLNRPEREPHESYLNRAKVGIDPAHFDHWTTFLGGYYGTLFNEDGALRRVKAYSTDHIARAALGMLRRFERTDARPWFLVVAPFAPHPIKPPTERGPRRPVAVPRRADEDAPVPTAPRLAPERDVSDTPPFVRRAPRRGAARGRLMRVAQLRALLAVDDLVRRVTSSLQKLDEQENTLAFFLSDNGFLWGEHGLLGKGVPYTEAVSIPLLVRWPGALAPGTRDARLVANLDVAPTIFDAANIGPVGRLDGVSLLAGESRSRLLLEYWAAPDSDVPSWAALREGSRQYVEYYGRDGQLRFRELYDLRADPAQTENLVGSSDPAEVRDLARALAAARRCRGAPCP